MKKKVWVLAACLAAVFTAVRVPQTLRAAAANASEVTDEDGDGVTDNGYQYTRSGATVVITGVDESIYEPTASLSIPATITVGSGTDAVSYPVSAIGDNAFSGMAGITSVTIPGSASSGGKAGAGGNSGSASSGVGVRTIGAQAFYQCLNLSSVSIPNTVTSIGSQAFSQCDALSTITVAAGNNYYISADGVLYGISGGKYTLLQYPVGKSDTSFSPSDTVSGRLTTIGDGAFAGAFNLDTIVLPGSVSSIGKNAFYSCKALTTMELPDSITKIEASAFEDCTSLSNVTTSDSLTTIGVSAFKGCTSLSSFPGGDSLTTIGASAFYNCASLTEVTIPYKTTVIGESAFYGCSSLNKIVIPTSVTSIGSAAFAKDPLLTIFCHANSTAYNYANTNRISLVTTCTVSFYSDQNELIKAEEVISGASATPPGMGSRTGYSLVWEGTYKNVTADTIVRATWVRTYTITFSDPYNSRKSTVKVEPGRSAAAPNWTMTGYSLRWDTTGGSYQAVYADATVYAQWVDPSNGFTITKDTAKPLAKKKTFVKNNVTYMVTSANVQSPTVRYISNADPTKTSVTIANAVTYEKVQYKITSIAAEAFLNNTTIETVTIKANVKTIGDKAFYGCSALSRVNLKSKKITSFGEECFYGIKNKAKIYTYASKKAAYKKKIKASGLAKKTTLLYREL